MSKARDRFPGREGWPEDSFGDRMDRFGCVGQIVIVLAGLGLVAAGYLMTDNPSTAIVGWIVLGVGVVVCFIGAGWTFLYELLWFWP